MHKLVREVRFSINPFLGEDAVGANSFCSKPSGEGLGIYFELSVVLAGEAEKETGFVVNVVDIDKCVRESVVPVFGERIRGCYREGKHVGFGVIAELLRVSKEKLAGKFGRAALSELSLKLNPYRKVSLGCEDNEMIYFSEKFEFAAMHKLWNEDFSEERNFEVFGKCANLSGHGHNYVVEVTVKKGEGQEEFCISDFERVVDEGFVQVVDHKNLNVDVERFSEVNPTVENIAVFAWDELADKFEKGQLHCITVWETDRTYCSYYG